MVRHHKTLIKQTESVRKSLILTRRPFTYLEEKKYRRAMISSRRSRRTRPRACRTRRTTAHRDKESVRGNPRANSQTPFKNKGNLMISGGRCHLIMWLTISFLSRFLPKNAEKEVARQQRSPLASPWPSSTVQGFGPGARQCFLNTFHFLRPNFLIMPNQKVLKM